MSDDFPNVSEPGKRTWRVDDRNLAEVITRMKLGDHADALLILQRKSATKADENEAKSEPEVSERNVSPIAL